MTNSLLEDQFHIKHQFFIGVSVTHNIIIGFIAFKTMTSDKSVCRVNELELILHMISGCSICLTKLRNELHTNRQIHFIFIRKENKETKTIKKMVHQYNLNRQKQKKGKQLERIALV